MDDPFWYEPPQPTTFDDQRALFTASRLEDTGFRLMSGDELRNQLAALQAEELRDRFGRVETPADNVPSLANGPYENSPIALRIFGHRPDELSAAGYAAEDEVREFLGDECAKRLAFSHAFTDQESFYSLVVRFRPEMWDEPSVDLAKEMDEIRKTLLKSNVEVRWSCAEFNNKRTAAIFTFEQQDGVHVPPNHFEDEDLEPLKEDEAEMVVADRCHAMGYMCALLWATYPDGEWDDDSVIKVRVQFNSAYPVALFSRQPQWTYGEYNVSFEPDRTTVFPDYPSTIVLPDSADVAAHLLEDELWSWVRKYNEMHNTHQTLWTVYGRLSRLMHRKHRVVTPSTVHLALFLGEQQSAHGRKWELVYYWNDRDRVPFRTRINRDPSRH